MRNLYGVLLAASVLACTVPTDVTIRTACHITEISYFTDSTHVSVDSVVVVADTVACPR